MEHNHQLEPEKKYTCPMHPEIVKNEPGLCPLCGMKLVEKKETKGDKIMIGHDKHEGHSTEMFLKKFWISFILTIPVVLYSELPEKFFGWRAPVFYGSEYISLILSSAIYFYGGYVFLKGAWQEIKSRLPGMMTLIAIAISAAYFFSVFMTIAGGEHTLFWELATLITIMLLGHWIEMKAVRGASGALKELAKLLPDTAEVLRDGKSEIVPLSELKVGDIVLVKPGGKVAADGEVIEGRTEINESMITGESKPVSKNIGDSVIAGSINGDGSLKIRVGQIGEQTFLSGIMRLVAEAEASKSRLQILSDRAAFYLTIIAVISGGVAFISWILAKAGIVFATERLVAVLVIACPHALGLAVPLVASISTTLAARNGFLVKRRLALELARKVDIVLFDKTGTLTKGEFGVTEIIAKDKESEYKVLQSAASIDNYSEHPISKAIVKEAANRKMILSEVKNFERIPGKGSKGFIGEKEIVVGSETLFLEFKIDLPKKIKEEINILSGQGKTIIYAIFEKEFAGVIALADIIRDESREAIAALKKSGIKTAMITGDSEEVAKWVTGELSIDEYFAKVLPSQKSEKVKLLQDKGLKVAMVGDGINDAPALTQADLGIAIGAGTNVAIESAGIILVRNDPRDIPKIIKLSKLTYSKMIQNLFWATGYNIVALPLAAGVLASKGILLQPALSAVFMSVSTVIVAINAMMLRKNNL